MTETYQRLINGDARDLSFLEDKSIHLVVTSPPYWNLKRYNENPDQLGHINDYESFLIELEKVWREVFRVLVPGGRLVCAGFGTLLNPGPGNRPSSSLALPSITPWLGRVSPSSVASHMILRFTP